MISIKQEKAVQIVEILGDIDLFEISKLKALFKNMQDCEEIWMDLSHAVSVSTAFIHLLVFIKLKLPKMDIKIINPNKTIVRCLELTRVIDFMEIILINRTESEKEAHYAGENSAL
ncbi:MAG: hypothetical protein V1913_03125 [Fibrobacterota bacterium]